MQTVTRLYDRYSDAQRALSAVRSAGIPDTDISVVANSAASNDDDVTGSIDRDQDRNDDRAEGASTGIGIGAALGGAAGLLTGLGIVAIPGVGPVVAAGWLASTALGAAVGGTAGGLVGALSQSGVSEEYAHTYAEGVRRGGTVLSVRVPDERRAEFERLLGPNAVQADNRTAAYREDGWNTFDPAAPAMTPDEVRRERERYRAPL